MPDGREPRAGPKTDLRVERTRVSIWNALVGLIAERGYEAISVRDIASRAGVNRSTIYRHYEDKEDLFRQGCVDLLDSVFAKVRAQLPEDPSAWTPEHYRRLFELVSMEREALRILGGAQSSPEFLRIVADRIEAFTVQERLPSLAAASGSSIDPHLVDLCAHALSALLIGILTWWVSASEPMPVERIAGLYEVAVGGAVREILGGPRTVTRTPTPDPPGAGSTIAEVRARGASSLMGAPVKDA